MKDIKGAALGATLCLFLSHSGFCWNALGHQIITQIAYNHLTPHAKNTFNHYNQTVNKVYKPQSLVNASIWLDKLRGNGVSWFNELHYIDWYFSSDNTPLPTTNPHNALWAINKSIKTLLSKKANDFDKGLALRILIHVVGDIHQPLHTASLVSQSNPNGDEGGNLIKIGKNTATTATLHHYWDEGGGFLQVKKPYNGKLVKKMADNILEGKTCDFERVKLNPQQWATESNHLAKSFVYSIKPGHELTEGYHQKALSLSKHQLMLAGCRLAALLNNLDTESQKRKQYSKRY